MEPTQTVGCNVVSEVSFQESSNMTVTWPVFSNTALLLLCALNCLLSLQVVVFDHCALLFSAFN